MPVSGETSKSTQLRPADDLLLKAETLFAGKREIAIEFNGEIYRLRITRNEKLILTK